MKFKPSNFFEIGITSLLGLATPGLIYADMTPDQYQDALKIADQRVQRIRTAQNTERHTNRSGPLASGVGNESFATMTSASRPLLSFPERLLKVGQTWDIVAFERNHLSLVAGNGATGINSDSGRVGFFHYEVVSSNPSQTHIQTHIRITQLEKQKIKKADPKVQSVEIDLDSNLKPIVKAYKILGREKLYYVSPTGGRSQISRLELFPIDMPSVVGAGPSARTSVPELPLKLKELIKEYTFYKQNLNQGEWLEQVDFFSRPILMYWRHTDPWPMYLETTQGVSLLINRGQP